MHLYICQENCMKGSTAGLEYWDVDELPVWACITSLRGKKTPSELRETTLPLARGIMGTSLRDWSRASTSYSDSSARKLHTNSLASFFRSCSERKRQTYDHKTADQSEPAGFCTQSQQKIPVLSRPCCTSSLAMAQVTVMISAALRRWTPSAVSSELERRDCSAGCR